MRAVVYRQVCGEDAEYERLLISCADKLIAGAALAPSVI